MFLTHSRRWIESFMSRGIYFYLCVCVSVFRTSRTFLGQKNCGRWFRLREVIRGTVTACILTDFRFLQNLGKCWCVSMLWFFLLTHCRLVEDVEEGRGQVQAQGVGHVGSHEGLIDESWPTIRLRNWNRLFCFEHFNPIVLRAIHKCSHMLDLDKTCIE